MHAIAYLVIIRGLRYGKPLTVSWDDVNVVTVSRGRGLIDIKEEISYL
jgi:hypothetical protein